MTSVKLVTPDELTANILETLLNRQQAIIDTMQLILDYIAEVSDFEKLDLISLTTNSYDMTLLGIQKLEKYATEHKNRQLEKFENEKPESSTTGFNFSENKGEA